MTLRDRKKEHAREALVAAAIGLFDERGIDATSTDDIAATADLSRATFFNYFPYKEAIVVDIGARFVEQIAAEASRHRRRSVRHALYDLADAVAEIAAQHPRIIPHIAREMVHADPERRRHAADRMRYTALYEGLLDALALAGSLRSSARRHVYARQLADITVGALVRTGTDIPIEQLRGELHANVDLFCDGAIVSDALHAPATPTVTS